MKRKALIFLPLILLLASVLFILLAPQRQNAPPLRLTTLAGQTLTEAHFHGKVSLVNFWFPSCPGCVSEMPKLIQMQHDHANQPAFQIIAISLAKPDPLSAVQAYAAQHQLPFAVAYDADGLAQQAYGVQAAPTSFLVDKNGRIVKTFVGEPESFPDLYQQVAKLIAE